MSDGDSGREGPPGPHEMTPSDTDSRQATPCFIAGQYTPYSCMICSRPAAECKRCSGCKAVSYCSPAHQRADWPNHKKLCKFVTKHVLQGPSLTAAHTPVQVANELFPAFRIASGGSKISATNQDALTRLPRCIDCGAFPATETCKGCGLVGHCAACHETPSGSSSSKHPKVLCSMFAASARAMRIAVVEATPFFSFGCGDRFHHQPPPSRSANDNDDAVKAEAAAATTPHNPLYVFEMVMRAFTTNSGSVATFGLGGWRGYERAIHWRLHGTPMAALGGVLDPGMLALIRDSYSGPLTTFAGVMMAPDWAKAEVEKRVRAADGTLVIHVVGAEFESVASPAWEVLLHLFAAWGVTQVAVGFIGPQVLPLVGKCLTETLDRTDELCGDCTAAGCTASAFFYRGTYEAFCRDATITHAFAPCTRRSDVTIAFNAGLHDSTSDAWRPGVEAIVAMNRAPVNIMTAYNPGEATADVELLAKWAAESAGPTQVAVSAAQPNPFRSPLFLADPATIAGWYAPNHTMWCFTVAADGGDGESLKQADE